MSGPQALSEFTIPYWMIEIYGGPGIGKTCMAGSSQRFRTLIIDVDQGAHAIIPYCKARGLAYNHIVRYPVTNKGEFMQAFTYLQQNLKNFDLVVVDTFTELQQMLLQEILDANRHVAADQRDWGNILTVMLKIIRSFRVMPIHTVMVSHEQRRTDGETGRSHYSPSFQGSFADQHLKHFSEVLRYRLIEQPVKRADNSIAIEQHRWIQCHPDLSCTVKERSAALSPWEAPDIDAIFAKLMASTSTQGEQHA